MENVGSLFRDDALESQPAKGVLERLPVAKVQRMTGGNGLGQQLGELAQLEDGGAGIVAEIPLGERPQLDQLWIVCGQEPEIARRQHLPSPVRPARPSFWAIVAAIKRPILRSLIR